MDRQTDAADRVMMATDAKGNRIDLDAIKEQKAQRFFVCVNYTRAIGGSLGPVVSKHHSWETANKAVKKNHRLRVLELSHEMNVGDHLEAKLDVIFSNSARWG
jgi:hypothetical protein